MPYEINLDVGTTGLTVIAKLIQDSAQIGPNIVLAESGSIAGFYSGNMPTVSAGRYFVRFIADGTPIGNGEIRWDGTIELLPLTTADYTAPDNASIEAIKAKTDNLPSDPADQSLLASAISAIPTTPPLNSTQTQAAAAAALTAYGPATPEDVQVTVSGGFLSSDRTALETARDAAVAAQQASEAVADGRTVQDYNTATATQYNADGTPRTVFELLDENGNPATAPSTVVERVPSNV